MDTVLPDSASRASFDPTFYAEIASLLALEDDTIQGPFDVHEALLRGLPGSSLLNLVSRFRILPRSGTRLERAIGVSLRTMQRKSGGTAKRLNPEQAGRAWQFAEILARATRVLGSQDAAERWLQHPAIGLDQRSPIDLLATPTGTGLVSAYLTRIEYGVYT